MTTTTATTKSTWPLPEPDIAAAVVRSLAAARDRPNPAEDAACSPQKYAGMSRNFRAGAWKHLQDDRDLAQGVQQAWGGVAETVKAISAYHGGIIHNHRAIWQVIHGLARLVGDAGDDPTRNWIINSFHVARGLHSNFYEDRYSEDDVRAGLILCEELSERLYQLFGPGGRSP